MTATDELRRLLDERGVRWDELVGHPVVIGTEWHDRDGSPCTALEHADDVPDGMLSVQANLTPEQAVEATLGRGTCHDTGEDDVRIDELNAENAKLRELVLDYEELTAKLCDSRECDGCPFDTESTMCKHMHMLLRVGELGVEV